MKIKENVYYKAQSMGDAECFLKKVGVDLKYSRGRIDFISKKIKENGFAILVISSGFNENKREWYCADGEELSYLEEVTIDITFVSERENPIKPNTQVKILSKEHYEYVKKLGFDAGFDLGGTGSSIMSVGRGNHISFYDDMNMSYGGRVNDFKEIFIEMPQPSIESEILAEKVNGANNLIDKKPKATASDILSAAKYHLDERARIYDRPEGERSISSVVEAFNALTGDGLMSSDERGWMFMVLLKLSRSQQGSFKLDNYEDGVNYFALMGESASDSDKKDKL